MLSTNVTDRARLGRAALAVVGSCLVGLAGLAPSPALAAPSPADAALAETLFRDGKELMATKRFDAACPKLSESNRLDPATGTLLALALCHEGEGRLASAWVEFTDVLAATADARPDRALVAREHIAQLEPQLSKLTVVVPAALAQAPGLEIRRDNVRLDRAAWGVPVPIDGGPHAVEARGGSRPWSLHFDVAATRDRRVVEVPSVVVEPAPASVSSESASPSMSLASSSRSASPSLSPAPSARPDVTRQRWGIALGALGVVGLGTGAYFGVTAVSKIHDAKAQCPTAPNCTSQAPVSLNAEGFRDATIADVALGVGVVAGALGLFLVLSGRGQGTARVRVLPSVDRVGGSVAVEGSF
jgi:hypothetical protein